MECYNILEFQNTLNTMRQIDDKIIHLLNTTIPTESFKNQVDPSNSCKDLFNEIETAHRNRDDAIKNCLDRVHKKLADLKQEDGGNKDPVIMKKIGQSLKAIRTFKSELNIEEVITERTNKLFYEKCKRFYKPEKITD